MWKPSYHMGHPFSSDTSAHLSSLEQLMLVLGEPDKEVPWTKWSSWVSDVWHACLMVLKLFGLAALLIYGPVAMAPHKGHNPIHCTGWWDFCKNSAASLTCFHSSAESHNSEFGNPCLQSNGQFTKRKWRWVSSLRGMGKSERNSSFEIEMWEVVEFPT